MQYFAYVPDKDGHEPCGTEHKLLMDTKTEREARRRAHKYLAQFGCYVLYSFTNIFDTTTWKEIVKYTTV